MNHAQPTAAEMQAHIKEDLDAALIEARAQVAMCEKIALALDTIAHHKRVNAAVATYVKKAIPELDVDWRDRYGPHSLFVVWDKPGPYDRYRLEFDVPEGTSMAQLIGLIRSYYAVATYGRHVSELTAQIENLPRLVETDSRIRGLLAEIEAIRSATSDDLFGNNYRNYHESVRRNLTALCRR